MFAPANLPPEVRQPAARARSSGSLPPTPSATSSATSAWCRPSGGESLAEFQKREIEQVGQGGPRIRAHRRIDRCDELNDEEKAMLAGEARRGAAGSRLSHQLKVGEFFGARGLRAGDAGPRHGRHRKPRRGGRAVARVAGRAEGRQPARADSRRSPIRAAPTSPRPRRLKQADWMTRPGGPRDRRVREARRGHDRHLHQLPDDPGGHPRRARRLRRYRRGDLFATRSAARAPISKAGPSALSAGLTGRTPRYGFHLDEHRQATLRIRVDWTPSAAQRLGRARRRDRQAGRQLLGRAGHRRTREARPRPTS